jgi:hypothetical protein
MELSGEHAKLIGQAVARRLDYFRRLRARMDVNDKPGRCKLYPIEKLERARATIEREGKPYPDPAR